MRGALNFAPQAIAQLRDHPWPEMPITRTVSQWVADMLERAQVFVLPDCGQLLDRARPKPEMPGGVFRPPFDVIACEYEARFGLRPDDPIYNAIPCSRRIALAWTWKPADLPAPLSFAPELRELQDGVATLSIFYVDAQKVWAFNGAALFIPYDAEWRHRSELSPYEVAMVKNGSLPRNAVNLKGYEHIVLPLALEYCGAVERKAGSREGALDLLRADGNDELVAYSDLCYALACKNVTTHRFSASKTLNAERRRKRRPELKDWHLLDLGAGPGNGAVVAGDRNGPRSHLRRGHIRRLGPDRMTWVNQTMVHGRAPGFVDKTYRLKGDAR